MNVIYIEDAFNIEIYGILNLREKMYLKNYLFKLIEKYKLKEVKVNIKSSHKLNKKSINIFLKEYRLKFNNKIKVNKN